MRITILQGAFLPVPALRGGAVEKMWHQLGAEFARRGHEVTHLSRLCDGLPAGEQVNGVRHVRVPGYERPRSRLRQQMQDLWYSRRAARCAPDADITVTNTFWSPLLLRARHGAIYVDVQRMPKGQLRLYRRAARLRANSSAVSAAILDELPAAAPRVRVIPNPLPFVPTAPVDWSRKARTVGFVGRIHPEKGIKLLLEAWARRSETSVLHGWTLELTGPIKTAEGGGGEEWARGLQQQFRRADIIWREPIYDGAALNAIYERTTVFAYPSLAVRGETFGQAALEAMAWGAIPVVSGLACFRDFVRDGENGFAFEHAGPDPAAALLGAIERAAGGDARRLAQDAVRVRGTHSCSSIATSFLEDFSRLQ